MSKNKIEEEIESSDVKSIRTWRLRRIEENEDFIDSIWNKRNEDKIVENND